jgi:hypothetical protein
MFCPKCSQQQVSEDTRFCSRCGFQLNVVKALLLNDKLPASDEPRTAKNSLSKRDISIGAVLMFIAAFVVFAITSDLPPFHSARIIFLIGAWFALTLLINIKPLIKYFLRGDLTDETELIEDRMVMGVSAGNRPAALPPSHSIPVDVYPAPATTAEMTLPPSVTEDTTNLLNNPHSG